MTTPIHTVRADAPLFFIMNGGSGKHDGEESREQHIQRRVAKAGRTSHLCVVENGADLLDQAEQMARKAKSAGGIVVAVGGDGTLNAVAKAALHHGCPMGIVPQGTFNYFGRTHQVSQELSEALNALLEARPEPVQVGLLNNRVFLVNASM
ncbi:MAG: acylglycerol kinase family protein, partial [Limnobacter sp.]|nr:acylglycerol kinase family protein [Limnobacter sp.]